jgi:cell division transport system permease protein
MMGPVYHMTRALRNLRRNLLVNAICTATIAIAMFILSVTQLVFWNFSLAAGQVARANRLIIYIRDGALPMDVEKMLSVLREDSMVLDVSYTSKDRAIQDFRASLGMQASILDGLEFNPLPASLEVVFRERASGRDRVEEFARRVSAMDGVESVNFGAEMFDRLERARRFIDTVGWGITALMILAVVFIVANTIRLNIFSRREEIEVQQLVGASGIFIRAPFLLEGAIQGLAGGLISTALLAAAFLASGGGEGAAFSTPFGRIGFEFLPAWNLAALVAAGTALGAAGSWLSLGRYIKRFIQHEE